MMMNNCRNCGSASVGMFCTHCARALRDAAQRFDVDPTTTQMMEAVGAGLAKVLERGETQMGAVEAAWDDLTAANPKVGGDMDDPRDATYDKLCQATENLAVGIAKLLRSREGRARLAALAAEVK
jgi:hypothetical protein